MLDWSREFMKFFLFLYCFLNSFPSCFFAVYTNFFLNLLKTTWSLLVCLLALLVACILATSWLALSTAGFVSDPSIPSCFAFLQALLWFACLTCCFILLSFSLFAGLIFWLQVLLKCALFLSYVLTCSPPFLLFLPTDILVISILFLIFYYDSQNMLACFPAFLFTCFHPFLFYHLSVSARNIWSPLLYFTFRLSFCTWRTSSVTSWGHCSVASAQWTQGICDPSPRVLHLSCGCMLQNVHRQIRLPIAPFQFEHTWSPQISYSRMVSTSRL